jgi:hypothetical protein
VTSYVPHTWIDNDLTQGVLSAQRLNEMEAGIAAGAAPKLASALPSSANAVDGQTLWYQTAAMAALGVVWLLRYNVLSSSAYKWEVVSAGALWAEIDSNDGYGPTSGGGWTDTANVGPQVTVPLAGDYRLAYGAFLSNGTAGLQSYCAPLVGAGPVLIADRAGKLTGDGGTSASRERVKLALPPATVIKLQYNGNGGTPQVSLRWLRATPIRVG